MFTVQTEPELTGNEYFFVQKCHFFVNEFSLFYSAAPSGVGVKAFARG